MVIIYFWVTVIGMSLGEPHRSLSTGFVFIEAENVEAGCTLRKVHRIEAEPVTNEVDTIDNVWTLILH